jgi:hypothetical protein
MVCTCVSAIVRASRFRSTRLSTRLWGYFVFTTLLFAEIAKLKSEIQELKDDNMREVNDLKMQLSRAKDSDKLVASLKAEIESMRKQLADTQKQIDALGV